MNKNASDLFGRAPKLQKEYDPYSQYRQLIGGIPGLTDAYPYSTGIGGIRGNVGCDGPPGPAGISFKTYNLTYAGLSFDVILMEETFAMIENPKEVNKEELSFIRVISEDEYNSIRDAWSTAWIKNKAYVEFEKGV